MSSQGGFIRNFVCPRCGVKSQFATQQWSHDQSGMVSTVSRCQNEECHRDTIFVYETNIPLGSVNPTTTPLELVFHYPLSKTDVHESIPTIIAETYKEGVADLNINSQKSAVLMFRRALQEICEDKGADPSKKLNEQIDSIITQELSDMAHEIRKWGNIGGHPDDLIQNIEPDDAKQIRELIDMMFDYLYIMPWKIDQSRSKRSGNPDP